MIKAFIIVYFIRLILTVQASVQVVVKMYCDNMI
jgi:hypothetical protein